MLLSLEHIVSLTHIVPLIGDVLKKKNHRPTGLLIKA